MIRLRLYTFATVILLLGKTCVAAAEYDPIQFGAKPDGKTLCTAAIQKAIDTCAAAGGGTVEFTKGKYLSGTIFYRSGVTLQLDDGATLLGSTDLKDYPEITPAFRSRMTEYERVTQSLIYAEKVNNIALRGKGQIDGQGGHFAFVKGAGGLMGRPFIIRMFECKDVLVENVTMRNSASWMQDYLACDDLVIRGLKIHNFVNMNNDCIDIDGCQNVHISDVDGSSDDDGLCFKGTSLRPTKHVLVENCRFFSYSDSLKFGTDSQGALEHVHIRNLELGPPLVKEWTAYGNDRPQGLAGMSWYVVDGATMQNVVIENIKIHGTKAPIVIRLGDRGRHLSGEPRLPPGKIRNVTISNVEAVGATSQGCPIVGLTGHPVENLTLRNITLSFAGGGAQQDTVRKFDEAEKQGIYPRPEMFAERLPGFGFYFWHVKGVTLENVKLTTVKPDQRPAIALEDVVEMTIDGKKVDRSHQPPGVSNVPTGAQP